MAQRGMTISIIGCLNNCIREYQDKMRTLRNLLDDTFVHDTIADEIQEHLTDNVNGRSVDEVLDEFFDQDHGMIKLGTLLIEDLQKAKWCDFDKMEILKADTDEEKAAIKQVVDTLN